MENILDRFLRYVAVDTQSDPESETQPSAAKELNLLRMLKDELTAMGVEATLDEYGYVMARIPSNCPDKEIPAIGFIAHADTAPDASGADIKPQIIENYDGGEIPLKGVPGLSLKPSEFPELEQYKVLTTGKKSEKVEEKPVKEAINMLHSGEILIRTTEEAKTAETEE